MKSLQLEKKEREREEEGLGMDKEEQQLETKKECTEQVLTAQWNAVQDWLVIIKPTKSGWFVLQTATVLPSCFTWRWKIGSRCRPHGGCLRFPSSSPGMRRMKIRSPGEVLAMRTTATLLMWSTLWWFVHRGFLGHVKPL